ncbi:VanZ family protein [Streptococcus macacae]|uniref:VanZ family protein n=1 Tax=Streptococcus macacae TaxID=1339 RepID=UPI0039908FFB
MFGLLNEKAQLTSRGKWLVKGLLFIYLCLLVYMCFWPQHHLTTVKTPGIQHFGRIVVLLIPFNSFVNFAELRNGWEVFWVLGQNAVNIFLLFPLMLSLLILFPKIRNWQRVLYLSFGISLAIETTQVFLDLFIDANRVFEIDDLWTNTLGGLLAFFCYFFAERKLKKFAKTEHNK